MNRTTVMTLPTTCVAAAVGLIIVFSSGAPISGAAQAGPAVPQIPQELRDRVQREGRVRVIVELKLPAPHTPEGAMRDAFAITTQRERITGRAAQLLAKLPGGSHRTVRRYGTVPYVALEVDAAALEALERLTDDVVTIRPDVVHKPSLAQSVPLIEADRVCSRGYDGTGMTIAVLDTGVDSAHPFLAGKVVEEACYSTSEPGLSQSFCPNGLDLQIGTGAAAPCPLPTCEHGTHVAGIAAGGDSDPSHPSPGVAKGAQLMAVQVFSAITDAPSCGGVAPCVGAFTSDIIAGLEHVYAVALAGDHIIASVNMSLGAGLFFEPCDDQPYKPIIDNLRAIGVATVIAAGNDGWPFFLAAPACISTAVSVGATDKGDVITWFTNTAPFLSLLAPGEAITSSVPGGGYQALSGTSMAAPHVAGVWGLLKQAAPGASVSTILSALQTTGLPVIDDRFGLFFEPLTFPRVRALQALNALAAIDNPVPVITSLSPASAVAGTPSFTMTVNGSNFVASSLVRWNGADRPTTFVSANQLRAAIAAGDIAAPGTPQVTVLSPPPGGGLSSALTFTTVSEPLLTVSSTTVTGGAAVTMTLTNGLGGASDWLALASTTAANTSYVQFTWVGAGVTSRTWTVTMPAAGGTYEFRLFPNNGYTRAATSPPVTVTPAPPSLTVDLTTAVGGTPVTVTLTGGFGGSGDWLALASTAAANTSYVQFTWVGAGVTSRTWTVTMPAAGGTYEFRLFPNNGYTRAATSPPVTVTPAPPLLTVDLTTAVGGTPVTVTLTGGFGGSGDWLALASTTAANTSYVQYTWVGAGVTTRTWTVTMPPGGGTFEFRLFPDNAYARAATSPTVIVTPASPPLLTVDRTSAAPGSPVTVTLTSGRGGSSDWLAFTLTTAPDTSYPQWTFVGAGVTTRTWTVSAPATPGTYEFRLFLNNGYVREATSPPITVP